MKTHLINRHGLMPWVRVLLLLLLASVSVPVSMSHAQPFVIEDATFSNGSGGSASTNSQYSLSGTIAQPASGPAGNAEYGLATGFWSVVIPLNTPDAPRIHLIRTGASIVLSWSAAAGDFQLEETSDLNSSGAWTTSGVPIVETGEGILTVTLPITGGLRFYRLFQTR